MGLPLYRPQFQLSEDPALAEMCCRDFFSTVIIDLDKIQGKLSFFFPPVRFSGDNFT